MEVENQRLSATRSEALVSAGCDVIPLDHRWLIPVHVLLCFFNVFFLSLKRVQCIFQYFLNNKGALCYTRNRYVHYWYRHNILFIVYCGFQHKINTITLIVQCLCIRNALNKKSNLQIRLAEKWAFNREGRQSKAMTVHQPLMVMQAKSNTSSAFHKRSFHVDVITTGWLLQDIRDKYTTRFIK